jgi:adenosylcobinamide-GDP ribazoletransferase
MRAAVSFLTPFGGARRPGPRTLDWFPLVGAAMGLLLGGLWWATRRIWPGPLAAALVVVADLGITGLLHFDGLVDAADGLLPHLDRERRLAVMEAPDVGAFGIGVGGAALLLRWVALAALRPGVLLLGGLWCLSRTGMAIVSRTQPYARGPGGLATAFEGPARLGLLATGLAGAFALACGWRLAAGAAAAASGLAAGGLVVFFARRRIGGYTGDILGAFGVVAETAGLIVAAAKW